MEQEEKIKRSRRRADNRRKNLRDSLPKMHEDDKDHRSKKKTIRDYGEVDEDIDGGFSR